MIDQNLHPTRVKNVPQTSVSELVQSKTIVPTIMEDFENGSIQHHSSQGHLDSFKEIEIKGYLGDFVYVEQEDVLTIVELNYLNVATFSESSLYVYSQNLAGNERMQTLLE